MHQFTIKRSEWYRAKGYQGSKLLGSDDMKCCLGFYLLSCGFTPEEIVNIGTPRAVTIGGLGAKIPDWLVTTRDYTNNSAACKALIMENDGKGDEVRIAELFAKQDIKVVFID